MDKQEAIKILKEFHDTSALFSVRTALETVFPELQESEDERISKAIIDVIKSQKEQQCHIDSTIYDEMIAWLEKQGEQKPLPKGYEDAFDEFISHIPEKDPDSGESLYTYEDLETAVQFGIKWKGEQKPAWSEEDEEMFKSIMATCELAEQERDSSPARHLLEMQLNWLKSLKQRIKGE